MKKYYLAAAFAILFASVGVDAQSTAFTYQGRLIDAGAPTNGVHSLTFKLYDDITGGTEIGSTTQSVTVTNGIFTATLDFGAVAFGGGARYIEITIGSTVLSPRQPLTSAPYAIRSASAGNAELLSGQPASTFATNAALQAQNALLQAQVDQLRAQLAAATGGTHTWSKRFGSTSGDKGLAVAVDGSGNVFVTGSFEGTVNFGGGNLTSSGFTDIFIAKYSGATGAHLWSKRFGGNAGGADEGKSIAVDSAGNVFISGSLTGDVDFGGGLIGAGASMFLIKLSGANGAHMWSKAFRATPFGLAVTAGDVTLTGSFTGTVDFGGGPLVAAGTLSRSDIFVAKYSGAAGSHLWSQRFGSDLDDAGRGIAADSSGNVYLTGDFNISVDFGGGPLTTAGSFDIFLAKFTGAGGTHLWSKRFGGTDSDVGSGVAVDGDGNAFITGFFLSTGVDFGGGLLPNSGNSDVYLAKFTSSGTHQWSKAQGGPGSDFSNSIAVNNANVIITGAFTGTATFGGSLHTAGGDDIFAAAYVRTDGSHQWWRRFGSAGQDLGNSIASDSAGDIFLTGSFSSTSIDFGGGPLTNAGSSSHDAFVAKLRK